MNWKRKKVESLGKLGPTVIPPTPPKKEYEIMVELLQNAESFSNKGETETEFQALGMLINYISNYSKSFDKL